MAAKQYPQQHLHEREQRPYEPADHGPASPFDVWWELSQRLLLLGIALGHSMSPRARGLDAAAKWAIRTPRDCCRDVRHLAVQDDLFKVPSARPLHDQRIKCVQRHHCRDAQNVDNCGIDRALAVLDRHSRLVIECLGVYAAEAGAAWFLNSYVSVTGIGADRGEDDGLVEIALSYVRPSLVVVDTAEYRIARLLEAAVYRGLDVERHRHQLATEVTETRGVPCEANRLVLPDIPRPEHLAVQIAERHGITIVKVQPSDALLGGTTDELAAEPTGAHDGDDKPFERRLRKPRDPSLSVVHSLRASFTTTEVRAPEPSNP